MANNYNINIPSTVGLADADAAAICGPPAAPIVAGTGRNLADLTNAMAETRARKRTKETNDGSVSNAEVSQSVVRETAVAVELAAGAYPNAGAPAWAAGLIPNVQALTANVQALTANEQALTANVQALDANVQALTANVQALTANEQALTATVQAMDARMRLSTAQRWNHRNHATGGNFQQLVKVVANVGPPLPGQGAQNPPTAAVGTVYPIAFAPANADDLLNMTNAQMSRLAEWANDHFGIVAEDNVNVRRNKLLHHYLYE